MEKRGQVSLKISLICTAVIAAVLFVCVRFHLISVLYPLFFCFFVVLPHIAVILLLLCTVKQRYIAYRKAVNELSRSRICRPERKTRCFSVFTDTPHTYALEKSEGIHPNRAGPLNLCAS